MHGKLIEVVTVSRTGESLIFGSRKEPENGEEEIVDSWESGPSSLHKGVQGRSSSDVARWSFGGVGCRAAGAVGDERWKQQVLASSGPVAGSLEQRIREVEAELRRTRQERDILKKVAPGKVRERGMFMTS